MQHWPSACLHHLEPPVLSLQVGCLFGLSNPISVGLELVVTLCMQGVSRQEVTALVEQLLQDRLLANSCLLHANLAPCFTVLQSKRLFCQTDKNSLVGAMVQM